MAKRILNMTAEEMTHATKSELIEAIAGSEGRVLASETIDDRHHDSSANRCDQCRVCSFHGSRPDPSEYV